ncbi:MAG: phosphopantetheine-binding protein [Verrucomicrobiales bacterium]|nr:phosphopantetheine-binding protein [Verrucomicrobiales bacterium]
MQTTESLTEIEAVVRPHLKFLEEGDQLSPDQKLGEAGLDSMASIDLLLDIEERFDLAIPDDLLTEDSFSSLAEIAKMLEAARKS